VIVNRCFTVVIRDESGEDILYRRGVMWRSSFSLPLAEVRVLKSDTRPLDRLLGLRRAKLYYFSGGTHKLFVWQPSPGRSARRESD
jgi:membrane protein YdbS with pleckstrin-like domain